MSFEHIDKNDLNVYSVKEIVTTFTTIDTKISSLHECSIEDFLNLHSHFKNYYKQSKVISDNATSIFDIIAGKDNSNSFNDLNSIHSKLIIHLENSVKQLNNSINTLEKIITNLELMILPLKNFKQNLMTLKYLGTSMKINNPYSDDEEGSAKYENDRKNLEDLIANISLIYPVIDENLRKLKGTVNTSLFKLQKIKDRNIINIESILNQIHSSIHLISEKYEESVIQIPKLTQNTGNCSESIGKIITNLQFQDIIRQKMENIQKTHKNLICDLTAISEPAEGQLELNLQDEYLIKIRDITGLQAAILIQTNNEYQNAIEIITKKFIEIGEDISDISDVCFQFSGLTHNSGDSYLNEIENKLSSAVGLIQNCVNANQEFSFEVDVIHVDIERMAVGFESISKIEDKLNLLHDTFSKYPQKNHLLGINQLMEILSNDLKVIKGNVQQLFDQTLALSLGLLETDVQEKGRNINENNKAFSENIHSVLAILKENNNKVCSLLNQNKEISESILEEIRTSVLEVMYYDFFEKVIEEIIIELNSIYYKLKTGKDLKHDKTENLKELEKLYTMQSERTIHKHFAEIEDDNVDIFKEVEKIDLKTDEDDSLELF